MKRVASEVSSIDRRPIEGARPMKISFACPFCAAAGAVDASAAGRQARCKHCGHRFTIPGAGELGSEGYMLEEPDEPAVGLAAMGPSQGSTFVSHRGGEDATTTRKPGRTASESTRKAPRKKAARFPWQTWLVRSGIATAIAFAAIALLAPKGTLIAGCALLVLGMVLVLVGYGVGAYGAFQEDFIYGFFYLVFGLYTAYYVVTRWEDMWIWFACSTAGVGLVLLGTWMLGLAGVALPG
jgi:predicted Zn finger-like uncharacterized protein